MGRVEWLVVSWIPWKSTSSVQYLVASTQVSLHVVTVVQEKNMDTWNNSQKALKNY